MKILVINGPNINMLGIREPGIYGKNSYSDLLALLEKTGQEEGLDICQFQSNHEGAIVDEIQKCYGCVDGIVINPAAYTHTSVAILDALKSVQIPAVEVHISNISGRESFRHESLTAPACVGMIAGLGVDGYEFALRALIKKLS